MHCGGGGGGGEGKSARPFLGMKRARPRAMAPPPPPPPPKTATDPDIGSLLIKSGGLELNTQVIILEVMAVWVRRKEAKMTFTKYRKQN